MSRRDYEERNEPVEVDDCNCLRETEKAILVLVPDGAGHREQWIPKSIIHDDSEVYKEGTDGTLIVPRWFAEKEGLV